jgi:hypothetical protein
MKPLEANPDAGPIFFLLGALFPTGKCMDDEDIACNPDVWADKTKIVGLFTAGQVTAQNHGLPRDPKSQIFSCLILSHGQPRDT